MNYLKLIAVESEDLERVQEILDKEFIKYEVDYSSKLTAKDNILYALGKNTDRDDL